MPVVLDHPRSVARARAPHQADLVALKISNGGVSGDQLPSRLKLLSWGDNPGVKGNVQIGNYTVATLAAAQKLLGYDRIAIDFNHQTVPGSDSFQKDPVEVAGYGTPVIVPGDGLYLDNIQWTPAGKQYAANYHDLSPTVRLNANGQVDFIHSVALCRQGAVDDLHFFSVPLTPHSTSMADQSTNTTDYQSLLVALLQKLGVTLPSNPSDSDIAGAVDAFKAPAPAPAKPDEKKDATPSGSGGDVTPMSVGDVRSIIREELRAGQEANERTSLITLATSQGKVLPLSATQIAATPVDVLRTLVEKATPGTVPLTAHTVAGAPGVGAPGNLTALTAQEKEACKALGVPEDKFLKEKQADAGARTTTL